MGLLDFHQVWEVIIKELEKITFALMGHWEKCDGEGMVFVR